MRGFGTFCSQRVQPCRNAQTHACLAIPNKAALLPQCSSAGDVNRVIQECHGLSKSTGNLRWHCTWRDLKLFWQEGAVYGHVGVQHQKVVLSGLCNLEPLAQHPRFVIYRVAAHQIGRCSKNARFPGISQAALRLSIQLQHIPSRASHSLATS